MYLTAFGRNDGRCVAQRDGTGGMGVLLRRQREEGGEKQDAAKVNESMNARMKPWESAGQ